MSNRPQLYDLYDHQEEAFEAAMQHSDETGTFIIPTGGGKTFVQIDTVYEKANKTGGKVFVVLEPRINLAIQQIDEFYKRLSAHGDKPFRYMCVHSGRMSADHLVEKAKENEWKTEHHQFKSTTSSTKILREHLNAVKSGENLVIVGTYHSASRIAQAIEEHEADHVFCDECHYLLQSNFQDIHWYWDAPYHHYTATQRHTESDQGLGMNNVERFGDVIHRTRVKELVEKGIIVEPRLVWVNGQSANHTVEEDYYASLVEIWKHQKETLDYPPKLLVNATGTDQLHSLAHQAMDDDDMFEDVKMYHISSDSGTVSDKRGEWINSTEVSRREWVNKIKEEEDECIIFHYDIVSEGIDVPGISASAFFRSIESDAKVMQIMGRSMRVLEEDRGKPFDERKKQNSWIYVPYVTGMEDQDLPSMREHLENIIRPMMRMGIDPVETTMVVQPTGTGEEEDDELFDRLENDDELQVVEELSEEFMYLRDVAIEVSRKFVVDKKAEFREKLQEQETVKDLIKFYRYEVRE